MRASEIRGQDGTGILVWQNGLAVERKHNVKASEVNPNEFLLSTGDVAIGQNRLAIFGLTEENNQPIVGERFALVHNGNLLNHETLFRVLGLPRQLKVDTEAILRLVERFNAEHGIRDKADIVKAIKYVQDNVKGDMACIMLDKETGMIVAWRRYKPLFVHQDDDGIYLFSTEQIGKEVFGSKSFREVKKGDIVIISAGSFT